MKNKKSDGKRKKINGLKTYVGIKKIKIKINK